MNKEIDGNRLKSTLPASLTPRRPAQLAASFVAELPMNSSPALPRGGKEVIGYEKFGDLEKGERTSFRSFRVKLEGFS